MKLLSKSEQFWLFHVQNSGIFLAGFKWVQYKVISQQTVAAGCSVHYRSALHLDYSLSPKKKKK